MFDRYKSITAVESTSSLLEASSSLTNMVKLLEGHKMTTLEETYAEFADKLAFPDYFGRNMNALYDMLCDLSWLHFTSITIVIDEAFMLPVAESLGDKEALLNLLEQVSNCWATPISSGEVWDRGEITFKTILMEV